MPTSSSTSSRSASVSTTGSSFNRRRAEFSTRLRRRLSRSLLAAIPTQPRADRPALRSIARRGQHRRREYLGRQISGKLPIMRLAQCPAQHQRQIRDVQRVESSLITVRNARQQRGILMVGHLPTTLTERSLFVTRTKKRLDRGQTELTLLCDKSARASDLSPGDCIATNAITTAPESGRFKSRDEASATVQYRFREPESIAGGGGSARQRDCCSRSGVTV